MAVLLELVLAATYFGQEVINRWNYLAAGTPAEGNAAIALIQGFGCIPTGGVYPTGLPFRDMLNIQNASVVYQFASCRDVFSDTDFAEVPFVPPAAGLNTGAGNDEPPFVAYGFRTNRIRADIRRGTKRLAGVGQAVLDAGGAIDSATQGDMQIVAAAWSAILTQTVGANSFTFTPVIVSKERYNPATGLADPNGSAYRYFPNYTTQAEHLASGPTWEIYTNARSQNSRQYGKGR